MRVEAKSFAFEIYFVLLFTIFIALDKTVYGRSANKVGLLYNLTSKVE
jgi:hypothetical protein